MKLILCFTFFLISTLYFIFSYVFSDILANDLGIYLDFLFKYYFELDKLSFKD